MRKPIHWSVMKRRASRHVDVCWKKPGYPAWYKLKQVERKYKKSAKDALTYTTPASTS
ncbi:hypothetical protein CK203_054057 [Vitis vinifera]|uniref:Uncharacterized protein n=1 Tax=Vitis vinifera TaxID=29760 RepID=A0A438GIH6_VITVI|nr:hypothetical protein CK203_054057 [Vitis vinifera]